MWGGICRVSQSGYEAIYTACRMRAWDREHLEEQKHGGPILFI